MQWRRPLPSSIQLYPSTCTTYLFSVSILMGRLGEQLFHNKLSIVAGFLTGCFHPLRLGAWRATMPLPLPALSQLSRLSVTSCPSSLHSELPVSAIKHSHTTSLVFLQSIEGACLGHQCLGSERLGLEQQLCCCLHVA